MSIIAKRWETPYKLGRPILEPSGAHGTFDSYGVDSPFVFFHNGKYKMMYVGYDGIGYQTGLAESDDLLHWRHVGLMLERSSGDEWDRVGASGNWLLKRSDALSAVPELKRVDGKYWMIYHAYPDQGYEAGPAEIGLAWTTDDDLLRWNRLERPILSWRDGGAWEAGGLYKACLVENNNRYYLFYNAKNRDVFPWTEQIGAAVSDDLTHWTRCEEIRWFARRRAAGSPCLWPTLMWFGTKTTGSCFITVSTAIMRRKVSPSPGTS